MEIYTLEKLQDYIAKGKKINYLYFWGHQEKGSTVTKSCFSQWYQSSFEHNDVFYLTAEHYMMAEKARLFKDNVALKKILTSKNPGAAKAAGRDVQNFDPELWLEKRFEIVVTGNLLKFETPTLRDFLLNTGNKVLIEASPVDKIWGIGMAEDNALISNPYKWKGLNLLGFALMKVRAKIIHA